MAYWNSPFIEYVIAIFMILSGINFSLYFMCLKGKGKRLFQDDEFRWFMKSVSILTLVITLALVFRIIMIGKGIPQALFQSGYGTYVMRFCNG